MSSSQTFQREREASIRADATKAFANHEITKRSEGRWLLQRRRDDGTTDWTYAAEVVSLAGGSLYVGGDIQFVIFAHYSDHPDHESKLRWMGRCSDVGYYVAQKAAIGTGHKLIDEYDGDLARAQVKDWLADERAEPGTNHDQTEAALEEVLDDHRCPWESRHELTDYLWHKLGSRFMSDRNPLGMTMSARVYYAHAAIGRLCDLLDMEHNARAMAAAEGESP